MNLRHKANVITRVLTFTSCLDVGIVQVYQGKGLVLLQSNKSDIF
jgi:hypothetical protein